MKLNSRLLLPNLRYSFRSLLAQYPNFYFPLVRLKRKDNVVSAVTELVIEGFPRSGNSFASTAFTMVQRRPVFIAHHSHAASQVIRAVKYGIPTLVVIRAPESAVSSFLIHNHGLGTLKVLIEYRRIYESIEPLQDGYVVATFEEITTDFGMIIAALNSSFGTDFTIFEHNSDNVKRVFDLIEKRNRRRSGQGRIDESKIARPSIERRSLQQDVKRLFDDPSLEAELDRTKAVYKRFCALAITR